MDHRDPTTLRPHASIRHWPRPAKDSDAWRAFITDIREHGITRPLAITADGHVVDGETRRQAALDLQIAAVPVVVIPDTEVYATILRELVLHRSPSRSQKAYLAYPELKHAFEEGKRRREENLRKSQCSPDVGTAPTSVKKGFMAEAERLGISYDLLNDAATLHAIFSGERREVSMQKLTTAAAEIKAFWEPKILDLEKPIGLGAALAGIAGKERTEGREKTPSSATQLDFFTDGLTRLTTVFAPDRWQRTRSEYRERILTDFRLAAAAWPPDLRRELADALLSDTGAQE